MQELISTKTDLKMGFDDPHPHVAFAIWKKETGWSEPNVALRTEVPPVDPFTHSFHYGTSVFEGMKAHKDNKGRLIIPRVEDHWKRLNHSLALIGSPFIPKALFYKALTDLLTTKGGEFDFDFKEQSLYIRPLMFNSSKSLGPSVKDEYTLYIMTLPHSLSTFTPVKCTVETEKGRAVPGGVATAKTCGNYASTVVATEKANKEGYAHVLWTDAFRHEIFEEFSVMNLFIVLNGHLVTPSLKRGTVLGGITRKTILEIAPKQFSIPVFEQDLRVRDVMRYMADGIVTEVFGTGTALVVVPMSTVRYDGRDYHLPGYDEESISYKVWKSLGSIHTGNLYPNYTTPVLEL